MRKRIIAALLLGSLLGVSEAHALTATLGWNDNSNNESGFIIYKANTSTEPYVRLNTVGAGIKAYIDTTALQGNCYKVTAYNGAGESAASNVACVNTPTAASGLTVNSVK